MSKKKNSLNNSNCGKKTDDDGDVQDVCTLIRNLDVSLKQHIDEKVTLLSKDIKENQDLISKATDIATRGFNLANDNSKQIESLLTRVGNLEKDNTKLKVDVSQLSQAHSTQVVQIKVLQHRLEDQTCRNSRNTLIIRGVPEQDDEETDWNITRNALCTALAPIVNIPAEKISSMIERVHRRGKSSNPNHDHTGPGAIDAKFFNWNHSEELKRLMWKNGKDSNIYLDQRYGPDTTWRRNKALIIRRDLKASGEIFSGWVKYPAKLLVKYSKQDKKYTLYDDYSRLKVPLPEESSATGQA